MLPLPGYDVVYPNNSVGNYMKELLKEDGLTSESMCQQVRQVFKKMLIQCAYIAVEGLQDELTKKLY